MIAVIRNTLLTFFLSSFSVALFAGSIQFKGNEAVSTNDLMAIQISLSQVDGKFVPDPNGIPMTLDELVSEQLSTAAIDSIIQKVSAEYQQRDILAVRIDVTRSAYERALAGQDLVIAVTEGAVASVRVVSMDPEVEVPDAVKERILDAAPIEATDKLDGGKLDQSIGLMNRFMPDYVQPVLMSTSSGELEVEYRVNVGERVGFSYGIDNYGSEAIGEIRHSVKTHVNRVFTSADRFQLSGSLSKDESTSFVRGEYFLPLDGLARNRLRFSAYHSTFNSEDIGVALLDYSGETTGAILGFERTIWSGDALYLDITTGAHYMRANQDNSSVGIPEQDSDFLLPFADITLSRSSLDRSWMVGFKLEKNLDGVAGTGDAVELARMGRLDADSDFLIGTVFSGYRAYIDPIFSQSNRRAHELIFAGTAKTSFGSRVPANFLNVLGGRNTVRGYSVAAASGDSSFYAQFDYRMHLNRFFPARESDSTFRFSPRFKGDMPPVDLSLGLFTDYGVIDTVNEFVFEEDSGDLWSAGLGFYGKASRHVAFSAQYAWILRDYKTTSSTEQSGDGQFYFSVDFNY